MSIASAVAGSDYTPISSSLNFPVRSNPDSTQCVDISIISDDTLERDEAFAVELTVLSPGVRLGNNTTTITIRDRG